jgi:glyoxylase-like metal-dependent hydrolase (beta-lactamase superfamily II)
MRQDFNTPQELVNGIYWLGMRRNVRLETNTYLLVLKIKGKELPLLIDPGGPTVLNAVAHRVQNILGNLEKLRLIFLSHQDPDVGLNISSLLKKIPGLTVMCTDDVWRLAHTLGISSGRFLSANNIKNQRVILSEKYGLRLLPIPFCPTSGACMLYDEQSRILFSGGLFGGITFTLSLFATRQDWEGIRIWHQVYISTQKVLQQAIKTVRAIDPPPLMIASHHGTILKGDMIPFVLDQLSDLPVGIDVAPTTEIDKAMYIEAINDVLTTLEKQAGADVISHLLQRFNKDLSFPHLFTVKDGKLTDIRNDVLGDVMSSFKMLLYALVQDQSPEIQDVVRKAISESTWNLPMFMNTFMHRG